jgi:hypothetical protein
VTVPDNAWVFDTGPLRHFSMQGWLGVLRFLAGERPVYIPDSVERELNDAAEHVSAAVRAALEADWIRVHCATDRVRARLKERKGCLNQRDCRLIRNDRLVSIHRLAPAPLSP